MKFISNERIKHRLVALVVLFAIGSIFLPAIMKKSNYRFDEKISVSVRLPEKPHAPVVAIPAEKAMFKSVQVAHVDIPELNEHPQVAQIVKAEPISIVSNEDIKPLLVKSTSVANPVKHQVAIVTKPTLHSETKKESYAVQLATFSDLRNAQSLVTRLHKQGYKATYMKLVSNQKTLYKVVVGEANQKNEAINLQKKLADTIKLNGFIVKTGVS